MEAVGSAGESNDGGRRRAGVSVLGQHPKMRIQEVFIGALEAVRKVVEQDLEQHCTVVQRVHFCHVLSFGSRGTVGP